MANNESFPVGMEFQAVQKTISEHVYETPLAFLRENVQNALDAIRMQAHKENKQTNHPDYEISIDVSPERCVIRDNGIGMSREDLRSYFWTIGASGKRSADAKAAGCVGMFGIGGFANFGICSELIVTSQSAGDTTGTRTGLSQQEIDQAGTELPKVSVSDSEDASPRGTLVEGRFKSAVNIDELKNYITSFVQFSPEKVTFNTDGVISQKDYFNQRITADFVPISPENSSWTVGNLMIVGQYFRTRNYNSISARIIGIQVNGEEIPFQAMLRLETGHVDVLKRGFKLCATSVQTQIGVNGRIDSDSMAPTAGRDSLNATSQALLQQVAHAVESIGISLIVGSRELLAQHTRIYAFIVRYNKVASLGNAEATMADGSFMLLKDIQKNSQNGVGVFFGVTQKEALNQIMQARGNLVVILPSDHYRKQAIQLFLTNYCGARPFSGIVEINEVYSDLDRFERVFLSELEITINSEFEIQDTEFIAGSLTEDIPVYVQEAKSGPLKVWVDIRHPEIVKLRQLEFGPLLYSLISTFCREYLGPTLRKQSPKFFGSGAMNFESLEKRRSELWVLIRDEIHTVSSKRQTVRSSDIQTINVGSGGQANSAVSNQIKSKLLHIVGDGEFSSIFGYYIRIPDSSVQAFGDIIKQYEVRGVVWAGNKILFTTSDGFGSAFQFEVRLENVIIMPDGAIEGAVELEHPIHELSGGLYFPLPEILEPSLIPVGAQEIRLEVTSGDWIDTKNANAWRARSDI